MYSDVFDYPLTYNELYYFVMGEKISKREFYNLLMIDLIPKYVINIKKYYLLHGKEFTVEKREWREKISKKKWKKAITMNHILKNIPFVRMTAITGSLAYNSIRDKNDDIDYFIIVKKGHLWKTRLLIYSFVRLNELFGIKICPNYMISDQNLILHDRNSYSARELKQMIPLYGNDLFTDFVFKNNWVNDYYPNAQNRFNYKFKLTDLNESPIKIILEKFLSIRLFKIIERSEMHRQIRKIKKISTSKSENNFSKDCCKSHIDGHGIWINYKFNNRLNEIINNSN